MRFIGDIPNFKSTVQSGALTASIKNNVPAQINGSSSKMSEL